MKHIFITVFLVLISGSVFGQGSGIEMLSIAPTPFSLSKAEATTSVPDGAASIFSNPALLSLNENSTIDLGYSIWIAEVSNIFGGINLKKGRRAIAFSFYSSGSDGYEQRNQPGPSNGDFSIQYLSIAAAYSYDFEYFSLGAAAQYLNEENSTYRASGYAFNLGIAETFMNGRLKTGASISNLGEMTKLNTTSTDLPTNFKIGASADIVEFSAQKNNELPILVSVFADFVNPIGETNNKDYADYTTSDPYFNVGLSLGLAEVVEISAGYKTQNNIRPLAFGAAVNSDNIKFNYALIPFNTGYGTVHSIGIQYKF